MFDVPFETYGFEDFELDTASYQLRRGGQPVQLEPKAFDLLLYLIEHRDRVVSKGELLDAVWGGHYVSDAALTTALRTARRAIGDSGSEQRFLKTVHRRGYRFVADASDEQRAVTSPEPGDAALGAEQQHTRFCRASDGTRIAYATVGSGPPLVKAASWTGHLDLEWSKPLLAYWLRGLADGRELIRYDERGCGLSDRDVASSSFDDWVADLEAVVDAVGLKRFPLLGVAQGGAIAVAYAVRHPERVSRLVLAGAYARGREARAATGPERDAVALDQELARVGWTKPDPSLLRVVASQFLSTGSAQEWEDFVEFQRASTSPANTLRFLEEVARIDVSDIAPRVACPTLIIHARHDVRVPASQATELASLIPDSELHLLDSRNHLLRADEPAWPEFVERLGTFLAA